MYFCEACFWYRYFIPLMYVSIHPPILHGLDYCSYTIVLKLGRILFFFFRIILSIILVFLFFSHILEQSVSTKHLAGIFGALTFNLNINLERINIFSMFILLIHEHSMSFLLFWSSLISSLEFCVFFYCWVEHFINIHYLLLVPVEFFYIFAGFLSSCSIHCW